MQVETLIGQIASVRSRVARLARHSAVSPQLLVLLSPLFEELDAAFRTFQIAEQALLRQPDASTALTQFSRVRVHFKRAEPKLTFEINALGHGSCLERNISTRKAVLNIAISACFLSLALGQFRHIKVTSSPLRSHDGRATVSSQGGAP